MFERLKHEMEEETDHAARLIARILFLEDTPDLTQQADIKIGKEPKVMLANDLEMELAVVDMLREAISVCEKERDYQTREILLGLLDDTEEDHVYWLEQQLGLIDKIGLKNYLQSQM
ncbi:ferritin-like domain-containing protein [Magnetococcus sp. PR-3]